ncbi:MAG: hypothetical protein K6G37_03315 [Bacilli bacterium]|nr:hypothetical protein [Bacilli bacterium]
MNYLEKIGFTSEEINIIKKRTNGVIYKLLSDQGRVVTANIKYLKSLGVNNYKEVFIKYPDLFLVDLSNFKETFDKYDREDLVQKLEANPDIIAYL